VDKKSLSYQRFFVLSVASEKIKQFYMTNLNVSNDYAIEKRRIISKDECLFDLKDELIRMFYAYYEAITRFEHEVSLTRKGARARGFEASLLNSKMIESIQDNFPVNWTFGKYKRFILKVKGYVVLFKKLNKHSMPMNIRTKNVDSIANQLKLALFQGDNFNVDPIVFFGYKKDAWGQICEPQLVYIDENQVRWTINEGNLNAISAKTDVTLGETIQTATPRLRKRNDNKAVNE
jgi:hypothetical protein